MISNYLNKYLTKQYYKLLFKCLDTGSVLLMLFEQIKCKEHSFTLINIGTCTISDNLLLFIDNN